jgi:hypothetical protein
MEYERASERAPFLFAPHPIRYANLPSPTGRGLG